MWKSQILFYAQHGVQSSPSKSMSNRPMQVKILNEIENNEWGIFFDLDKACDTVDHTILLKTLELCGFQDEELDWFAS